MKIKVLSNYNKDKDTRFGDCILIFDSKTLVVYDCGHSAHVEYVEKFLGNNAGITNISVVVSHNDSDHTNGICELLTWLSENNYYVDVYTHQYLKYVDIILDKIDDGRRKRDRLKASLLAEFDNIREIIETTEKLGFSANEALEGKETSSFSIVGPTVDEFTDVAAKAVDNRENDTIGSGHAEETVMNAASVQVSCTLDDGCKVLLCGDASPDYLKKLEQYNIIQLPHHGQKDDAIAIFEKLGDDAYKKIFLISDNTGSGKTSGGSDDLVDYMKEEKFNPAFNSKNGIIDFPNSKIFITNNRERRNFLGDLDCI